MARKKRKAAPLAAPTPAPAPATTESAGVERILLPALGALALICAWLALLGGLLDGTVDPRSILHPDSIVPRIQFREFFQLRAEDVLVSFSTAPHHFPDNWSQWALAALGAGASAALLFTSLLQAALSAAGWLLACDALFGKSPARRCVVLLLHALPPLVLAWRGADLFWSQLNPHSHYGAYATIPWLLWLSVRVLQSGAQEGGKKRRTPMPVGFAAGLVLLLALMSASDLLILPWFVAPMGLTALLLAWRGALARRRTLQFFGLLAAGCVVGRLLFHILPLALDAVQIPTLGDENRPSAGRDGVFQAAATLAAHMRNAAARNPMEGLAWLAFVAVAFWRAAILFRPSLRKKTPPTMDVPDNFGHALAAIYAPASILAALGGIALGLRAGSFHYLSDNLPPYAVMAFEIRYFMPAWFIPLFAGWALLPGLRAAAPAALTACAVVMALSAPKIARNDIAALNLFDTPFYRCFAENAQRLNWRAGISTTAFATVAGTPGAENRVLSVGVLRRPGAGQSFMLADINFNLKPVGEYQFVVANAHEGRAFYYAPLAGEEGCAVNEPGACWFLPSGGDRVLSAADARAAFGEPKEEINCAGVGLLHYDPPLRLDLSHATEPTPTPAYHAPVARW